MKKLLVLSFILCIVTSLHSLVTLTEEKNVLQLTMVYGSTIIDEPVLIELIKSSAFERLKKVRQYGVVCHAQTEEEYTRYQHSLGVFFLTRKYGAPLAEQIAALLHDVSHTVFSHVGDVFFNSDYRTGNSSYQDNIHEWYLEQTGVMTILKNYGYADACSEEAKKQQRCFDQPLPGLCADRIEYNLTGAMLIGLLTADDIAEILRALHFEDGEWFFDNQEIATKFAQVTLQLCEARWGGAWVALADYSAAQALKRACEIGIVNHQDIHFSTDDLVWQRLIESNDDMVQQHVQRVQRCCRCYRLCEAQESDLHLKGKFSGTDPLVATVDGLRPVSELDAAYKQEFLHVKDLVRGGWHIKLMPF